MMKKLISAFIALGCTLALYTTFAQTKAQATSAQKLTIATYNVENLFDMTDNGTEYDIYRPYTHSWIPSIQKIKLTNTARVIKEMNADVVALAEIESAQALDALLDELSHQGVSYPYHTIAQGASTVHTALISKYPFDTITSIPVGSGQESRAIIHAVLPICHTNLSLFVNHWKSKKGPESERITYANALTSALDHLSENDDYILLGDFNSNYDEFQTFRDDPRLNNTGGRTGINHILKTIKPDDSFVTKKSIQPQEHLSLWQELPPSERWSEAFGREKGSIDHIIIPHTLLDNHGINYVDGSFRRFTPDYLFKNGLPFRWQVSKGGKGEHLGAGFSDHLPLIATLSCAPFVPQSPTATLLEHNETSLTTTTLYTLPDGPINVPLKGVTLIYKDGDNGIVKEPLGRGVYMYGSASAMELGHTYDLMIGHKVTYNGLLEVKGTTILKDYGHQRDTSSLLSVSPASNLSLSIWQNEVVTALQGIYRQGKLIYAGGEIKLYFKDKNLKPPNGTSLTIQRGHISSYNGPQIVLLSSDDFKINR